MRDMGWVRGMGEGWVRVGEGPGCRNLPLVLRGCRRGGGWTLTSAVGHIVIGVHLNVATVSERMPPWNSALSGSQVFLCWLCLKPSVLCVVLGWVFSFEH